MKALLCTRYGTPHDLDLADLADPVPGPGEAVVRVKAAALNFFDNLIIAGKYQHKPAFPFSPAAEFAGEVERVGAGGTGLAAVELGKLMGARVIACASSDEKIAFARQHGANDGVNYTASDLKDALRQWTGGKGVDVVYDPIGGAQGEAALRGMDWGGRFLVIGFAAGDMPKLPLNLVLLRSYDVLGVYWGAWILRDPQGHRANMTQILDWCAHGKLSSHVHAVYPLAEAPAALKAIAARQVMGKAILRP